MRRIFKIIITTVLLLALSFVLFIFVIDPFTWEYRVRRESINILESAQTKSELVRAVGSLGIFLEFPDNSWMAIRYRDSHAGGIFSTAVALDSGGEWFESNKHFCGKFKIYPKMLEDQTSWEKVKKELGDAPNINFLKGFEDLHGLATSNNLETARKNLMSMGFTKFIR